MTALQKKKEKKKKEKKKKKKKKEEVYFAKTRLKMKITSFWFVLCTRVRNRFLEQKGIQSLQNMLRRKNTKGCRLLSKFIFHAINRRKLYVDV